MLSAHLPKAVTAFQAVIVLFLLSVSCGCATSRQLALWQEGRANENAGSSAKAERFYEAAFREGLSVARYDLAAIRFRSGDPKVRESALRLWLDASRLGATSFYSAQADSDAISVAALASLGHAFETGNTVASDKRIAGFLFDRAAELMHEPSTEQWLLKNGAKPEYDKVIKAFSSVEAGRRRLKGLYSPADSWDYFQIRSRIESERDDSDEEDASWKLVEQSHDATFSSWIFVAEVEGDGFSTQRRFTSEAARIMKESYVAAHPGAKAGNFFVCDQDRVFGDGVFTYKAEVVPIGRPEMSLEPSFSVSSRTGRGVLRIPCDTSRIANAFAFAQGNIETIVNSQNVLLTTGKKPPNGARYRVDDVKTVAGADGSTLLEVNFTVE